jgi:flavin reductase (DIM6/NTAB) family NADH-FMN oxidoreductase RutF
MANQELRGGAALRSRHADHAAHADHTDHADRGALDVARLRGSNVGRYLENALVDNAVALVTSAHGERRNVMTVTFFAESSHVPPLLRIGVAPRCLTHELITASGWFGLSLLAKGQEELALRAGTMTGWDGGKFERLHLAWTPGEHGVPLLPSCLTTSECRVVETLSLDDHTLFVGEIVSSYRQSANSFQDSLLISDLVDYLHD